MALLAGRWTPLLLASLAGSSLAAQTGSVQGRVTDSTGAAIAGAMIYFDRMTLGAATTSEGRYQIRGVPAGTVTIRARAIGFVTAAHEITVTADGVTTRDFVLERSPVRLAPIDVVVGSRARHTAAEELAVPVDVIPSTVLTRQGTTETSQILQAVSPSVNFPRQAIADADAIVRPFTFRGLSPDHTLVLVNGQRRHRTALLHIFAAGMNAGSTGVDLNALPSGALDRIEILRDGASAQYGSDAIAGVVNFVVKNGDFAPYLTVDAGRYNPRAYPDDGESVTVNAGRSFRIGRGSLGLFAEYRHREPTNRAWPDPSDQIVDGDADEIDDHGNIVRKNNPVEQPNHHWGDGLAKDLITFATFRLPLNAAGSSELYASGGWSRRLGTGYGFRRQGISERNWPEIYPQGFLPEFRPTVKDWSAAGGIRGSAGAWGFDIGASYGHDAFRYQLENTLNVSLGPCLDTPCAPGIDGILGTADDPGIPNQTRFHAGTLASAELELTANISRPIDLGLRAPGNLAFGISYRREMYRIEPGEPGSYINGGHLDRNGDIASPGSQVFGGFRPENAVDVSRGNFGANAELEATLSRSLLVNGAVRFESYSDAGSQLTGKAAVRYQPSRPLVFRAAVSTGFRAPSLAQTSYNSTQTSFILDPVTQKQMPLDFGIFATTSEPARLLGATPLENERSFNLSGGFVWSPGDRFSVTVDGYLIRIADRIILTDFIAGPEVEEILADNGYPTITGATYFTNSLTTRTTGIDVVGDYRFPLGAGTVDLSLGFGIGANKIIDEKPLPEQLEGIMPSLFGNLARLALEKERPRWRNTLTANYALGRFHALVRSSSYGKFTSAQLGACDACGQTYDGKTLIDAEIGHRIGEVDLSIGARNVFDVFPEQASLDNGFGLFPWPMASPFGYNGRYLYVRAGVFFGR